jgi:hypothetical protein
MAALQQSLHGGSKAHLQAVPFDGPAALRHKPTLALLSTWEDQSVAAGADFLGLRGATWSGHMSVVLQNAVARPAL